MSPEHRVAILREAAGFLAGLPDETLSRCVPASVRTQLQGARMRRRLESRFLRRSGAHEAKESLHFENRLIRTVLALGPVRLGRRLLDSGVLCHFDALRRVVRAEDQAEIDKRVGAELAERITNGAVGTIPKRILARIRSVPTDGTVSGLAQAVLQDSALCWESWLHGMPAGIQPILQEMTPDTLPQADIAVLSHTEIAARGIVVRALLEAEAAPEARGPQEQG